MPDANGLSRRAHWAGGEPLANLLMAKTLAQPEIDVLGDAADDLLRPLGQLQWVRPRGGLYLWLRLPESIDSGLSGPLFDRAVAEGVLYVPGEYCYPKEGPPARGNMLRLSFGIPSCEEIRRGMESLARAVRQVLSKPVAV